MDDLLKRLAEISLALTAAEEAAAEGAHTRAREELEAADEGLAALREQWPQMDAAARDVVGRAAAPLRERADTVRAGLPRFAALSVVEPTPDELAEDEDEDPGPEPEPPPLSAA